MAHHFDPPWRSSMPASPRRKSRSSVGLVCPLAFSVIGFALDAASLGGSNEPQLALLRFALIAGAPAVAALAAMKIDGDGT